LPGKFGTPATTTTVPGTPAGVAGTSLPELIPSLLSSGGAPAGTAPTIPGASTILSASQAPAATPARTITTPGMPGTQALDAISKLKGFTGTEPIISSILKPFGLEGAGVAPEPTTIWDPIQKTWTQAPPGKIKIGSSASAAGLEIAQQRLQLARDTFNQNINEFNSTQSRLTDQAERSRLMSLADPFVKAVADPKYKDDKDAIEFANSAIEEINRTGQLPPVKFERAKAFGFEIPVDFLGKKKVGEKDETDLRSRATKYLRDRGKPITDANIQAIIDKGLVK